MIHTQGAVAQMDDTINHQKHSHSGTVTVDKQQQQFCIDFERLERLSGFPNHCNGVEGIHNFGDLCKYGHIRHARGELGQSLVPNPPLKQANKQLKELKDSRLTQNSILSAFRSVFGRNYGSTILF